MTIQNMQIGDQVTNNPAFYKELIEKGIFSNKSYIFGIAPGFGIRVQQKICRTAIPVHDGGFVRIMPVYTRGIADYPLFH